MGEREEERLGEERRVWGRERRKESRRRRRDTGKERRRVCGRERGKDKRRRIAREGMWNYNRHTSTPVTNKSLPAQATM